MLTTRPAQPRAAGIDRSDPVQVAFLDDPTARTALAHAAPVGDRDPDEYAAVVYAGGYGAVLDFPQAVDLAEFTTAVFASGGWISAVCHGPAGLLALRHADGSALVAGRHLTAFSVAEEVASDMLDALPLLLPDALTDLGAHVTVGSPFRPHVVVDGHLVTGQNPASAPEVARRLAAALGPSPTSVLPATVASGQR